MSARALLKLSDDKLRQAGLSRGKVKTLRAMSEAIEAGLDLKQLAEAPEEVVHETLTALPGIGPWTADVYLLFCLGHGDAWPAGDLAVQEAVKVGLGLAVRPTPKQMMPLAEAWRPLRGAAAHLWWSYYRAIKNREGVIGTEAKANGVSNKVAVAKPSSSLGKIAGGKTPR